MNLVELQSDGRLRNEARALVQAPLACLGHQVRLADDCTLRSVFRLLTVYSDLIRLGEFYPSLMERCRECPADGCRWGAFDYLALSKTVEMVGYPGKPRLDIYNSLHGVRAGQPDQPEEIRSLDLSFLLDMPLRLGPLRHVVFGDRVDLFSFETAYTLFEFIDSIAWELSFHGTPRECKIGS